MLESSNICSNEQLHFVELKGNQFLLTWLMLVLFTRLFFIVISLAKVLNCFYCRSHINNCEILRPLLQIEEKDGLFVKQQDSLKKLLNANPFFNLVSKAYSFFYWFPRNNLPYDKPWILFRNSTVEWLAWYQLPHNLPPYGYLGEGYPSDFFCWGLPGNTLPLGNWDPWGMHQVSEKVVRKYRESEIKHGRIAMLASVGFIVQEIWHPLYNSKIGGLSITHFKQLRELHDTGIIYDHILLPLCKALNIPVPGAVIFLNN